MSHQKLLTPNEVCSILGIRMSKFRSAVFKKEIPIIKIPNPKPIIIGIWNLSFVIFFRIVLLILLLSLCL